MFSARTLVFVVHKNTIKSWNLQQKRFISPLAAYNKRLEAGELLPDEHQKNAVTELENLYNSIQKYTPKSVQHTAGGGFFGFLSKSNNDSGSISSAAPKGVYLFGSVGGGKTTLMDMFFDCCDKVR